MGFEESGGGTEVVLPSGEREWYPGCPAKYVTPEIRNWVSSCYTWWRTTHKTPMDLGLLTIDECPPQYFDAMEFIHGEVERIKSELMKRKGR
jgi:hypothetical protein